MRRRGLKKWKGSILPLLRQAFIKVSLSYSFISWLCFVGNPFSPPSPSPPIPSPSSHHQGKERLVSSTPSYSCRCLLPSLYSCSFFLNFLVFRLNHMLDSLFMYFAWFLSPSNSVFELPSFEVSWASDFFPECFSWFLLWSFLTLTT